MGTLRFRKSWTAMQSNSYKVVGRYYGSGKKFKEVIKEALSAPGAVSYALSVIPGARVVITLVK
jgi:hypothetical protein